MPRSETSRANLEKARAALKAQMEAKRAQEVTDDVLEIDVEEDEDEKPKVPTIERRSKTSKAPKKVPKVPKKSRNVSDASDASDADPTDSDSDESDHKKVVVPDQKSKRQKVSSKPIVQTVHDVSRFFRFQA